MRGVDDIMLKRRTVRFPDDEITNAVNQMTAVPYTVLCLHMNLTTHSSHS